MTCVLGMVVRREREIRDFDKTPFYRVIADIDGISAEWKAVKGSAYFESPKLYKENGFRKEEDAKELIESLATELNCAFTSSMISYLNSVGKKGSV